MSFWQSRATKSEQSVPKRLRSKPKRRAGLQPTPNLKSKSWTLSNRNPKKL